MLYADKRFLVHVNKAETDGELLTINGSIPVRKGDVITTNQLGNQSVLSEVVFDNNYDAVKKAKKRNTYDLDDIASAYMEMGKLIEETNNDDYIFEVKSNYIDNIK
jgi:siroheme synthase